MEDTIRGKHDFLVEEEPEFVTKTVLAKWLGYAILDLCFSQ